MDSNVWDGQGMVGRREREGLQVRMKWWSLREVTVLLLLPSLALVWVGGGGGRRGAAHDSSSPWRPASTSAWLEDTAWLCPCPPALTLCGALAGKLAGSGFLGMAVLSLPSLQSSPASGLQPERMAGKQRALCAQGQCALSHPGQGRAATLTNRKQHCCASAPFPLCSVYLTATWGWEQLYCLQGRGISTGTNRSLRDGSSDLERRKTFLFLTFWRFGCIPM